MHVAYSRIPSLLIYDTRNNLPLLLLCQLFSAIIRPNLHRRKLTDAFIRETIVVPA